MTWNLAGTYVESCSCVVTCPCTVSFDLGANLDYCRILLAFSGHKGDVNAVALSVNAKFLAAGGGDKKVHVWDVAKGAMTHSIDFDGARYALRPATGTDSRLCHRGLCRQGI